MEALGLCSCHPSFGTVLAKNSGSVHGSAALQALQQALARQLAAEASDSTGTGCCQVAALQVWHTHLL
jgi:hypothetical protein